MKREWGLKWFKFFRLWITQAPRLVQVSSCQTGTLLAMVEARVGAGK